MSSYSDLLDSFAASLDDESRAPAGLTDATRTHIEVYRNNVRLNRIAALADAFTHVVTLVGSDYFRSLARAFVIATPAASANLHDDGAALPAFIRGFAPAADLPYLGDVAEVDWLMQRAYYADDSAPLNRASLAELGPDRFAAASLRFSASVGVARSAKWPIADIVAMHEGGPAASLDAGGQAVLVWREGFAVRWRAIDGDETQVVAALWKGSSIENALSHACGDPNSLLAHLFSHGLVHAIVEPENGKH
ncbi:HvfC/BufC N-terminal domain-containing protein [Trinickia mobilis]|uniref:HvfC/BufC N-terminal domain-containing protein n=1 Tax=Trinickia mobilis TaxID=2816356 RepID=UPI001A8D00E0|nr:DNA-binding domain-containing protein [Trinickia mobilis]